MGPGRFGSRLASVVLVGLAGALGPGGPLAWTPAAAGAQAASPGGSSPQLHAGAVTPAPGPRSGRPISPVRWTSGVGVWSLQPEAIRRFVETGVVSDRSLASAIDRSGWSPEELRLGLAKHYSVDLVALARFLYSSDGLAFLRTQTRGYGPSSTQSRSTQPPSTGSLGTGSPGTGTASTQSTDAVEALRSAIIAAAAGGQISALAIMAHLPTDFSTGQGCGPMGVCAPSKCVGEAQCTSLLSWYVFLPACLQANQARLNGPDRGSPAMGAPSPQPLAP